MGVPGIETPLFRTINAHLNGNTRLEHPPPPIYPEFGIPLLKMTRFAHAMLPYKQRCNGCICALIVSRITTTFVRIIITFKRTTIAFAH